MVNVIRLLSSYRSRGIEITHIEGALDIMLEAGAGQRQHIYHTRRTVNALRAEAGFRVAVHHQLLAFRVKPHTILEGLEFIFGQVSFGPFPKTRRLGDMGITVEGWKFLGHRRELLNGHDIPPLTTLWWRCW